ncbi:AAA domain-containing protein [Pseudobutyrivibrio sp. C4]|uniref:AAA domain-containing protein n=1 Tax=Pseudobutyrivibrio sp. C4 TaxID=1520803 RepID=UPI0008C40E01|nr:AAA domain-containing protein [Pseudobutyrivibrio sp. C4]SES65682.1 AAA domain-containing protein [Pseudobutyrivibrio sp. C4]
MGYFDNNVNKSIRVSIEGNAGKYSDVNSYTGSAVGDNTYKKFGVKEIDEYTSDLWKEVAFLKRAGGRKYRATNGKFIANKNEIYTYSFDVEYELHLPDDSPLTLIVGTNKYTGSVLLCEGFQIMINIDKNIGASIGQAFISVDPWKLLSALNTKIFTLSPQKHQLAMKLLVEGPKISTEEPLSTVPRGQDEAVEHVINNDITVLWGPPGTGKTYTMAQIAIHAILNNKRVLVVSHSNVSVDGIVKQTASIMRDIHLDEKLAEGKVLRYGYVRDEILSKDEYTVAYNYAMMHHPDLKAQEFKLRKEKDLLDSREGNNAYKRVEIERKLKYIRNQIRDSEKLYTEKAQIVATTISKVSIDKLFDDIRFDYVLFDEVSMAYVPQVICAAMFATEKVILVGDFRQLSPIVQSSSESSLNKDIFAHLKINKAGKNYAHPWMVMLYEQRRMHSSISAFSNKYVYSNLLADHESVKAKQAIADKAPFKGEAINMLDLTGSYCAAMKNSDNSRFNIVSAIITYLTAVYGKESGQDSIGIITPYSAQSRLIRAMIQDQIELEKKKIKAISELDKRDKLREIDDKYEIACSTVHQFQGSERDVIIFDAVESYPSPKIGFLMGKDMDSVLRLVNVAVTRAKGKLIVVGNSRFWNKKINNINHIVTKLISYVSTQGNVVSTKNHTLQDYIEKLPSTKNIVNYQDYDEAIAIFSKDLERAKHRVLISIPDGVLDESTESDFITLIKSKTKANRIQIVCKTADYKSLPSKWKEISVLSENAVFPLIMIDDKEIWYGLPISRGRFTDGNSGFITVCSTIYRIRGEHTIGLISMFADLDIVEVDGRKRPLGTKGDTGKNIDDSDGTEAYGLDKYIRETKRCPKCRKPMMVVRGRSGKCFLRCTSDTCKETALLQKDEVEAYINHYGITCPEHRTNIYPGVSQYGLYIRCECGHYLKPDEI